MSDLIDRQAAIETAEEELDMGTPYDIPTKISYLPSAQQWIPCSERLPEKDGYYLTTTCYRQVYVDYWNEDHFDRTEAVIAWMPLPEPYKGE